MKQLTPFAALLMVLSLLVGCGGGDPYEATAEDMMDISDDMVAVLKSIEDVESAKAAGEKFEAISDRMQEVSKRAEGLEEPSEERAKELQAKYEPMLEERMQTFQEEMERIMKLGPEVMLALQAEMEKLDPGEAPSWLE